MSSAAQQTANRANAQHSTGPQTVDGKAAISQNANRHNLTGRLLIRDDEKAAFADFETAHRNQIQPSGALETTLFEQLLAAGWNLRRIESLEAQAFVNWPDEAAARQIDRLARYRGQHDRAFARALKELKALQTAREVLERLAAPTKTTFAPLTCFATLKRIGFVLSAAQKSNNPALAWLHAAMAAPPPDAAH